jgi:hypothetical protein
MRMSRATLLSEKLILQDNAGSAASAILYWTKLQSRFRKGEGQIHSYA